MSSWTLTSKMTGSDEITLKEVLIEVSKKLDRFIEAHSTLHNEIAQHESRHEVQAETRQRAIDDMREELDDLRDWQIEVKGQLKLIKWATSGGLVAAAAMLLKVLGVPLP